MSSLRVLQDTHAQHETQRVTLKEKLMWTELSQLDACLTKAKVLSKTIKAMHSSFRQRPRQVHSEGQIDGRMLRPTAKIIHEMQDLLNAGNLNFRNISNSQQFDKKAQQGFFMHTLRTYEGRIGELNQKIKSIENSIQSYPTSNQDSEGEEQFDEALTSYSFLERYLKVQTQKQIAFRACMENSVGSATSINSQIQSKQIWNKLHSKRLSNSILLKEKLVNERVKKKIFLLRKQQAAEKHKFQRLAMANKDTNSRIASLHLQASINSNNNFLLEAEHYARHWKAMKETLEARLSSFPVSTCAHNLQLGRSHSCAVMEISQGLQQDGSSLPLGNSVSIDNEDSLLDNLEYFISEEFIKDLTDHQVD